MATQALKGFVSQLPLFRAGPLRRAIDLVRAAPYRGSGRICPVCDKSSRRFRAYGAPPRSEAECVHCGALERHRFLWLYLSRKSNLFDGSPKRVLHVAPERCFEQQLRTGIGDGYLTADLMDPNVMVEMDITDIQYPDASFDIVLCSHVLEHVPDDRGAMREFRRVLRGNGWAILNVPITAPTTYEDATITEPEARLAAYGQVDHVRRYGPDYLDRLTEAGFAVTVLTVADLVDDPTDVSAMGLSAASGEIYLCRRDDQSD